MCNSTNNLQKYFLTIISLMAAFMFSGCHKDIWNEIDSLKAQINALQVAQKAYENHLYVTSVNNSGNEYTIVFSDGTSVKIANGKDGKDGKDGDTIIKSIAVGTNEVTFILSDGTSFSIPLYSALSIKFDFEPSAAQPNASMDVDYFITSNLKPVSIEVLSSFDIKAKAVSAEDGLNGTIQVKFSEKIDEYSKVVVLASNGERMIMHTFHFEEAGLVISSPNELTFSAAGGTEDVSFLTNMGYEVAIPDAAKEWISVTNTKSMAEHSIAVTVKANESYDERTAVLEIRGTNIKLSEHITLRQEPAKGLVLTKTLSFFDKESASLAVNAMANEPFSVEIPASSPWIHKGVVTKALSPAETNIAIDANNTEGFRTADVGFLSESGIRCKYSLIQFGTNASSVKFGTKSNDFSVLDAYDDNTGTIELAGIKWGDENEEYFSKGASHQYAETGSYTVEFLSTPITTIVISAIDNLEFIDVSNM